MSLWKKAGYGLLGISAILGRRTLSSAYDRQIEGITDAHIKYVGGAMLFGVCGLVLNFIFLMNGMHGMQTALFGVICLASLYYMIAPKMSIPLIIAAAAVHAGEAKDQAKLKLLGDGVKDIVNLASLALFWIGVYIVGTIIAPWDLSWEFFLFLHMFIIMALLLFVSGKASVSTKVYDNCFKFTIAVIVVSVLTIAIGREHVGPLWAQFSASKTSRIEAKLNASSIKTADEASAEWIEKNVHIDKRTGEQFVIVTDKVTGKQKPVAAQPYIEREKQRRNETIRSVTEKGGKTNATNTRQDNKGGYFSYEYWNAKAHEWSESWGVPLFVGIIAVLAMVVAHFIPVIWGGKKLFGKSGTETAKVVSTPKESGNGLVATLLVAGALVYIGFQYTQGERGAKANMAPQTSVATYATLKKGDAGLWMAYWSDMNGHSIYRLPQDRWHGRTVSLLPGSSVSNVSDITLVFDPNDPSTNISFNGDCVAGSYDIQKECVGYWRTEVGSGTFRLEWWGSQETFHIALFPGQLPAKGQAQAIKEIRFVKKQ
ncbi:MAG: hypothetical protein A2845_02920 [Candidatus Lloydbacteria bacterium RIFCSPHIGHO2_01_FULL_49_22]|uniref:Uncharacterized protein n=1 Tax=Candidatus Lloydbacteria bacterium RIFCSPHIGHO2_01_FULL_49_22 TaxID=1798658 RepID=A0A1G2CX73_9BACT|nr:MAG: hypothetical protein A2845_02920 [Candidatus Lloydbacteria bacterium RIFCSPHIGHO2_01_FULL_49_22]OGZ10393.1 MAG: hypothetical protein A3C14_02620 [Candidatus Lloydbacteria bacterium RIFCSPHIGHO2_02_FULL_50_18]